MAVKSRLERMIFKRLTDDAAISAVVGTKVSPVLLDQEIQLPALIYEITGTNPLRHLTTRNNLIQADCDILCMGTTYLQTTELGELVRLNLSGFSGTVAVPSDVEGQTENVQVLGCSHTDDRNEYSTPVDGGRTGTFIRRFSFLISYRPEA